MDQRLLVIHLKGLQKSLQHKILSLYQYYNKDAIFMEWVLNNKEKYNSSLEFRSEYLKDKLAPSFKLTFQAVDTLTYMSDIYMLELTIQDPDIMITVKTSDHIVDHQSFLLPSDALTFLNNL